MSFSLGIYLLLLDRVIPLIAWITAGSMIIFGEAA